MRKKQSSTAVIRPIGSGDTVFIYLRDSGGAEQERSVTDQLTELTQYAARLGLLVAHIYTDAGFSGGTDERPAFLSMLAACRETPPPVRGILIWSMSRFGRNELDRQFYVSDLRRRGISVKSISEHVPDGPLASVIESFMAWKDAEYLRDLSRDVKRGLRHSAGVRNHGRIPPIGYVRDTVEVGPHRDGSPRTVQVWRVDQGMADKVREAFRMFADGASHHEIHNRLRLFGTRSSYRYFFANPIYIGVVRSGDVERVDESLRIVDNDVWNAVQVRRKSRIPPRTVTSPHLLSGILVCGICGYKLQATKSHGYSYYTCRRNGFKHSCDLKSIRDVNIEPLIMSTVLNRLTDDGIAAIAESYAKQDNRPIIEKLQADIAQSNKAIAGLLDIIEAAGSASDDVRERIAAHQGIIAESKKKLATMKVGGQTPNIRETLQLARAGLLSNEVLVARRVLTSLIKEIVIRNDAPPEIVYRV